MKQIKEKKSKVKKERLQANTDQMLLRDYPGSDLKEGERQTWLLEL